MTTPRLQLPANTTATALPDLSAAAMRRDLRDKGVQTITIGTIPEQMLFDVKWFVVEAGKPVRVTLDELGRDAAQPHHRPAGLGECDRHRGGDHEAASRSQRARVRPGHSAGAAGHEARAAWRIGYAQFQRAVNAWASTTSSARFPAIRCACTA